MTDDEVKTIIHIQQSAIRATRKAQGALHKGEWLDAIILLETALRYAGLRNDQSETPTNG